MKLLWKPPYRIYESMAFPKKSPLLPFFNQAFYKLVEGGSWLKAQQKWKNPIKLECKHDNVLSPIPKERVASLFLVFGAGIFIAIIVLIVEKLLQTKKD